MSKKLKAAEAAAPVQSVPADNWVARVVTQKEHLLALLLIVVAVWLVFSQVSGFAFLHFDDSQTITDNPLVQAGITWGGLRAIWGTYEFGSWYPVAWLSHMFDAQLYGPDAGGHHFTSLLVHMGVCLLLFTALAAATGRRWLSALVALLFAVHPLHVEPVAWLSQRKDLLAALFACASLWTWTRSAQNGRPHFWVTALLYILAVLSNPSVAPFAIILLLVDSWPLQRQPRITEAGALFLIGAAAWIFEIVTQSRAGAIQNYDLARRLANTTASLAQYLYTFVWPSNLSIFYPYPEKSPQNLVIAGAAILVLGTVIALWQRSSRPWLFLGWAWFVLLWLPVSGIIQVGVPARGDRFIYLAIGGLLLAIVWTIANLLGRHADSFLVRGLVIFIVLGFTWRAWIETAYWKNDLTVFSRALDIDDKNRVAHSELGTALLAMDQLPLALPHLQKAIQLEPNYALGYRNLAEAMFKQDLNQQALDLVDKAISLDPNNGRAYFDRGKVLREMKRLDEAYDAFERAQQLGMVQEMKMQALFQQGLIRNTQVRYPEAIDRFQRTLEIDPYFYLARKNLAFVYLRAEQYMDATREFNLLARTNDKDEDVLRAARFLKTRVK